MIENNINKPVNHTNISSIIQSARTDCNYLLIEFHSNPYIFKFVDNMLRTFNILELLYQQILKEPRIPWLKIQSDIEDLYRKDSTMLGVIIHLDVAEPTGSDRGFLEYTLPKKR